MAVSRLVIQRAPTYSSDNVKKLMEMPAADVPNAIVSDHQGAWLRNAKPTEVKALIEACMNSGSPQAGGAIDTLLDHSSNWRQVAEENLSLWGRAVAMLPSNGKFYKTLTDTFLMDTESVANGYLNMNEEYCDKTLKDMAYTREGQPIVGPPTAEQQAARDNVVDKKAAQDLLDMQNKLIEVRKTKLGTRKFVHAGGRFASVEVKDVLFDPEKKPEQMPDYTPDPAAKPWDELKKAYDVGAEALGKHLSLHPNLYVLVRDKYEDTSKTEKVVAGKDTPGVVAAELARTTSNINTARPYVRTAADEMTPIHRQLREGSVTSPSKPGRNWAGDPVWRPVADTYNERTGNPPWWQTLGFSVLEMAVFAVAGLATGGIGFAAAMMVKGAAEAAKAAGKASVLTAASQASVSEDTRLVDSRKAEEAQTEAAMALAFAALDAVMLGAELKALGIAGKVASSQTGQAIIAVERSAEVLELERRLLGRVDPAEVKGLADKAKDLARQARTAATEAEGLAAKGAQEASRARVAKAAAERAEKAAKRVEGLAAKAAVKEAIPEEKLVKAALPIPLKGGGRIVISNAGIFVCRSPCMMLTEKYAALISRNPELAERAVAVRMAEQDVEPLRTALKGASGKAVEKRLKNLVETFEKECKLFEKAEEVTDWLKKQGSAETKDLDAAAITRVLRRGPNVEAAKGQLLEEIAAVKIRKMLLDNAERMKLAGKYAGKPLEFVPGHRLRDSNGRQFTDGVIGFWEGDTFRIVTVVESKAGRTAAEGLKYSKEDLQAIMNARWTLVRKARRGEIGLRPDEVWAMRNSEFERIYKVEVDAARRRKGGDEWRNLVTDDVKDEVIEELRAAGKHGEADKAEMMKRAKFETTYASRVKKTQEAAPLPEGGQFALDIERGNEFGGQILNSGELPQIAEKGTVTGPWKDGVPPGTWKPTKFAGSAGATRMQGFVPFDADAAGIAKELTTQNMQGQVTKTQMTTEGFGKLATDILEKGK